MSARAITAGDLLRLYLELRKLSPDLHDWSEGTLGDNPPRLVRLRQLMALFRAFEIPWSISTFRDGMFIREGDPGHGPLLQRVTSEMPGELAEGQGPRAGQLPALFSTLLRYRETLEPALSFASGVMEASGLYYYAYVKVKGLNQVITKHVRTIEDILVELISPGKKAFTITELVRGFDYPADDLDRIDEDWQ